MRGWARAASCGVGREREEREGERRKGEATDISDGGIRKEKKAMKGKVEGE